ncbi:hypothetical protein GCM10009665_01560 [Kitasatospora nipponensis]|uniref:MarR family protein n=1 Tax=Kitasatospora nipponensis TaxID=258049 RepID=A0ABN1VMS8_9ACTN
MSSTITTTVPTQTTEPVTALTGTTAAVYTELCGQDGISAAALALAAHVSPSAARKALVALEQRGLARRTPGGNDRTRRLPDLWSPATPGDNSNAGQAGAHAEAALPSIEETDLPCDAQHSTHLGNVEGDGQQGGPLDDGLQAADSVEPTSSPIEEQEALRNDCMPGAGSDEADPAGGGGAEPATALTALERHLAGAAEGLSAGAGAAEGGPGDAPSANTEAVAATTRPADTVEHVCCCPTCGYTMRRPARKRPAAVTGAGPRLAPGQLHQMVLAHLRANPEHDWTPTKLSQALGRSSGATANALDTMVARGEAVMTSAKPRRYQAAVTAPAGG